MQNGNMVSDYDGSVRTITGIAELVQAAMIRLTMRRGSFPYQSELGSRLFDMDIHHATEESVWSVVEEALQGMEEVTVLGVKRRIDPKEQRLYLTIDLQINGEEQQITVTNPFWEGGR